MVIKLYWLYDDYSECVRSGPFYSFDAAIEDKNAHWDNHDLEIVSTSLVAEK